MGCFILSIVSALSLLMAPLQAVEPPRGDWPQWMGPNRSNHAVEANLLTTWPDHGPPLLWKTEGLGHGVASVAVSRGRIFTLGYREQQEFVTALDENTGKILWSTSIGPEVREMGIMRYLAQRTPTVDGDLLYAVTADGRLICLEFATGKERWRKDFLKEYGGARGQWGFCDYPLIDGDRLICTPGAAQATFVALNKRTGEIIWKTLVPNAGPNAYSAVIATELGGIRQYINFLRNGLVSVAATDGQLLWRYNSHVTPIGNTHNLILLDDGVFSANGRAGSVRLRLTAAPGTVNAAEVFRQNINHQSWFGTAIRSNDFVITLHDSGLPQAQNLTSGELIWKAEHTFARGRAAMTLADGHLYLRYPDGEVLLMEVSPQGTRVTGCFAGPVTPGERAWTLPVVTGGRLYIRDHDRLFCYDVQAPRRKSRAPDAIYVPTPQDVVEKMLELAQVKKTDLVYDLGCGDGRIVITAARRFGARAVGVELDPECVQTSLENVKKHQLEHLVRIEQGDLFKADFSKADVVALYLLPKMNEKLIPALSKLKPGTRIIAHHFPIPGFAPDQVHEMESAETGDKHKIYLWTIPLKRFDPR